VVLLQDLVIANDLIEYNVKGALNANFAFYKGMSEGGGLELTDIDVVNEVWARETAIRTDTKTWINAYLAMAYQPLADTDLAEYLALSKTSAGQALNSALFEGFDRVNVQVSFDHGRAAARFVSGTDL